METLMPWVVVIAISLISFLVFRRIVRTPVSLDRLIEDAEGMATEARKPFANRDRLEGQWRKFSADLIWYYNLHSSAWPELIKFDLQAHFGHTARAVREKHWERFAGLADGLARNLRAIQEGKDEPPIPA